MRNVYLASPDTVFRLSLERTFLKGRARWADPTFMSVPSKEAEELHRRILSFIIIFFNLGKRETVVPPAEADTPDPG